MSRLKLSQTREKLHHCYFAIKFPRHLLVAPLNVPAAPQARINWDWVETATGYRVSRKAGSTGDWTELETVHGTELNVTEEEPCVSVTYAVAVLTEEQVAVSLYLNFYLADRSTSKWQRCQS